MQAKSTYAVNASTTSPTLPVVTVPLSFLDLTLQTFTPDQEQALVDSVQSSLSKAANVNISLANIVSGSVNLVVETIFLDANQEAALQLLNNAQQLASVSLPCPCMSSYVNLQCLWLVSGDSSHQSELHALAMSFFEAARAP